MQHCLKQTDCATQKLPHHHHQRRFNSGFPGEPGSPLVSLSTLPEENLWGISGTGFL